MLFSAVIPVLNEAATNTVDLLAPFGKQTIAQHEDRGAKK
jgi:hypothetical protein